MKARPIWDNRHVSNARERALKARGELRQARRDAAALVATKSLGSELVKFARARLDDDEAYARNAFGEHNDAKPDWHEPSSGLLDVGDGDHIVTNDSQVSRFMERFDPTRVLAEVEAKRGTLRLYEDTLAMIETLNGHGVEARAHEVAAESYLNVIRLDAAVYALHPEYDESWRP